ncbi:MAG: alpha/beta hydrolase [Ruminococcaceae bacterium]|nr:alpha/beta hydrolase [Oscillospiraceae bacterium]
MSLLIKENFSFLSSNGTNTVKGFVIRRQQPPYKAIIQISHGMKEHSGRYEEYMNFMAEKGYVMVSHDHIGHGMSVNDKTELGFFASKDGYIHVLNDLATTAGRVKKSFPQLKLILFGHSMGSFYARAFAAKYHHLVDGAVISGTGGKNPLAAPGKVLINLFIKVKGERSTSKLITKVIFGSFLNKIKNPKTASDWLTRDEAAVEKYRSDEYCRFYFTLSGYKDLVAIQSISNTTQCFENAKKDIPYLIVSGDMDPVGEWGKGVKQVFENYKKAGVKDITLKLYEGGRHEMLNELNKEEVYTDILNWIENRF